MTLQNTTTEIDPAIPRIEGAPVLGNVREFTASKFAFLDTVREDHDELAAARVGRGDMVILLRPDTIKQVLVEDDTHYTKTDFEREELSPLIGNGLLISDGDFWQQQRQIMNPAFSPQMLDEYVDVIQQRTHELCNGWTATRSRSLQRDMSRLTVQIIADALFSTDLDRDETDQLYDVMTTIADRFDLTVWQILTPEWVPTRENIRYYRARRTLSGIVDTIIDDHRRAADPPRDLVTLLLEAQTRDDVDLSTQQIHDEVMTFLLAGHETTALALTYALYLLASHPDKQAAVHAEVDAALDSETPPDIDALNDLEMTEAVIREAMRQYPPVPLFYRESMTDTTINGYQIPAGTTVMLPQWTLHRDPRYYDDPQTFRPERWQSDRDRPNFAYFPFGGGSRICIGRRLAMVEAQIVLAHLLHHHEIELESEIELDLQAAITARPRDPIPIVTHPRSSV